MSFEKTDTASEIFESIYMSEVKPVLEVLDGPVSAFVFEEVRDLETKHTAVRDGYIRAGAFRECAIFDTTPENIVRSQNRRKAKVGQEVLIAVADGEVLGIGQQLALMHTRQEVNRTVIVEAARVIKSEEDQGTINERHRATYTRALEEAQEALFTAPNLEHSDRIIRTFQLNLKNTLTPLSDSGNKFISEFLQRYPWLDQLAQATEENSNERGKEALAQLGRLLHERYDRIFNEMATADLPPLSNDTLTLYTNEFMKRIGLGVVDDAEDYSGWLCVPDSSVVGFQVRPGSLRVLCGRRSTEITQKRFKELMVHEVLGHVIRAENGRKTGIAALQTGMPGANDAEEGVGLTLERAWASSLEETLERDHFRYLAVAYAGGVLDGSIHTETETFKFISEFMTASKLVNNNDDPIKVLKKQRGLAYDHVKRAYRGMPEGVILWSNTAYLVGRLDITDFAGQFDGSTEELLAILQAGKYNPANPTHAEIVKEVKARQLN